MKWFEKAVDREKIIHLFDGDLDLNNVFLDTVLCYDYKLDLVFYVFDLPTNFPEKWQKSAFNAIKIKGTIYQFTPPTTYCIYENIKKDDFRFGSRLFNFNSCSLLKSYAFYIIVGNFQGQFFHLKTTV